MFVELHNFATPVNSILINPFLANVPILYSLKTPENQRISDVFKGYKIGTLARYGLIKRRKKRTNYITNVFPSMNYCKVSRKNAERMLSQRRF